MNWEFTLFPEADTVNYINDKEYKLPPCTIIAIPNTAIHRIKTLNPNHCHTDIFISDKSLKDLCQSLFSIKLYESLCEYSRPYYVFSEQEFQLIKAQLLEIYDSKISDTRRVNLTRAVLIHILSRFYQQTRQDVDEPPKWLSDFVEKLHEPTCFCLPVPKIYSTLVNYSKSRFCHLFKKHYGCTLTEYVDKLKLTYAENMLCHSDKSILEISALLGYDSLSSFTHFFQRKTGITPSKYRRQTLSGTKTN